MGNDKEIVLYYPYMNIVDSGLIKTAALYWDEIQTIVPNEEYRPGQLNYPTDSSSEAEKEHFLKPRIVNPIDEVIKQAGTEIVDDIERTPQILDKIVEEIKTPVRLRKRLGARFSVIHTETFDPIVLLRLKNIFARSNIVFDLVEDLLGFIWVPTLFYEMYMSRVASIIATKDRTTPLTNESLWQDAINDRYIDYSKERKRNQSQLAIMSLKIISIGPNTPLTEILRFKDKREHRKILLNFRRYIRELARQVSTGLDTTEKQCVFEEVIKDKILPVKEEIESKLSEDDITFGLSAFDIAQATAMGAFASGGTNWRTGIAGAGISLTISLVKSLREDRNIIKGHPLGYLYKAQKKFGAKN